MPKQINVKMGFEADTSQAKKQIQDLQKSLDGLMTSSMKNTALGDFSKEMVEAQQSAIKLKSILGESMNVDTGRLDLVKFNQQLQDSGLTLSKLGSQLSSLGPEGKQAFLNLADSIVTAQKPMIETNRLLDGMWTALKNTARWQLSSSILHGFIGALQGAYGYAQDLDKSLNSIRIVSGQSTEQMARFAEQANKSAQALSTSTLAYTDASLIFYQQGLTGEAVTERVDTVLKLSNVTGDSAEQVSSYMTAIWNNFYDGSQSLESFADKITALGAATAASSAEIASGLQQFAAIGNTVGLSYDYAATALATIVAQTRQSESSVGNGLRTVFARLSSLKQGDTDEDGTDLTKYTKALAEYGVNVKDQNGELRQMDQILDDIGAKWQTLSKDQKVALAQTVGGVRQYATIMALFDNWDDFQKNLMVTQGAEGTLQGQAEIYAESWEAARKRVQAAWQAIYQDLIDDKFFIRILNGFASILKSVDGLIDSIGGLKSVLAAVGVAATQIFGKQLEAGLKNAQTNINKIFFGDEIANYNAEQAIKAVEEQRSTRYEDQGKNEILDNQIYQIKLNNELRQSKKDLTKDQLEYYEALVATTGEMAKQSALAIEEQQNASRRNVEARKNTMNTVYETWAEADSQGNQIDTSPIENILAQDENSKEYKEFLREIRNTGDIENVIKSYTKLWQTYGVTAKQTRELIESEKALDDARKKAEQTSEKKERMEKAIQLAQEKRIPLSQAIVGTMQSEAEEIKKQISLKLEEEKKDSTSAENKAKLQKEIANLRNEYIKLTGDIKKYKEEAEGIDTSLSPENKPKPPGINIDMQGLTYGIQGISQLTLGITTLNKAIDTLEEPNLSWTEKFTKILPSIATGISSITMSLSSFEKFKESKAFTQLIGGFKDLGKQFINLFITPSLTGLKAFSIAMLKSIGPILAVVAAIWAIRKAWDAWKASTPEGKLKTVNDALNEATENTKKAIENYNKLTETFNKYNETVKNLNKLEGTEKQFAIVESNKEILDILSKIDGWEEKIGKIDYSGGLIKLTETQQEILKNEEQRIILLNQQLEIEKQLGTYGPKADSEYKGLRFKSWREGEETDIGDGRTFTPVFQEDLTELVARTQLKYNLSLESSMEDLRKAFSKTELSYEEIEELINKTDSAGHTLWERLLGFNNQEKWNEYLKNIAQSDTLTKTTQETNARTILGESASFDKLTDSSQEMLIEKINELTPEARANLQELLLQGLSLRDAFKEAGIPIGELHFSLEKLADAAHDIKTVIDADDLNNYKGSTEDLTQEVADLSDYIQNNIEKLADFDNHLEECRKETERVAYSIIRFDDAIQDVQENYESWMKILEKGTIVEQVKLGKELQKVYANLLDIDTSEFLGSEFTQNAENLKLMEEATRGVASSYDELAERAARSIILNIDPTTSTQELDNWMNIIKSDMDRIQEELGRELRVGENINDQALYDHLNEIIANTASSVEEAQAIIQALGYDAVVRDSSKTDEDEIEVTDVEGTVEQSEPGTISLGSVAGISLGEARAENVSLRYKPGKKTKVPSKKTTTASALEIVPGSLHKKASGTVKFQHSPSGAGTKGSSGGGGGGGNKGSSQPKQKTVKEHKKPEKKTDRYHDIKERIADLNTELKRLEKTESRVYGKAKLKYMDQEIKKLEKQIELTDEYIAEIQKYAKEDQANLRGIGMGAKFDENGRLTNYEQVLQNIVDDYNKAIANYNSEADIFNGSAQEDADNARLDAAEKAVSQAKEIYDERLKILDQYEDTFNLLQEKMDERIDQVWELFDQRLERVTWEIEFELDWNEKELTQLDWLLKYITKDADRAADAIANLSQQFRTYEESIEWAKQGIAGIFGLHDIAFDFDNADPKQLYDQLASFMTNNGLESQLTEKEAEALLSYIEALRDAYDGMHDSWVEAHEHMMNAFDEWNERLEEGIKDIENYGKELQNIQKIVDLTGRKMLHMGTQDLNKMNQAIVQNAQEALRAAKAQKDANDEVVKGFEERYQNAIAQGLSSEVLDKMQEEYREAMDKMAEVDNNFYSAWADALDASKDAFDRYLDAITEDYKNSFGKMDLDYMADQFKRQKDVRDLYLDDYQKYHELNKTAQELNKSLEATNNDLIRGKMLDLQDDMNASMESGVKISAAQAEIYARRVALLQAEAELLDAQNAKSAVRMTRDNEGNFSYTYTADQDQIGDAQNNYGDKFYELLEYERNYMDEIQGQMIEKRQEFMDRLREISENYIEGSAEYEQALQDLQDEYLAYNDYFIGEQEMDMYEMQRLRDEDWQDFQNITDLKLAEYDDFVTFFKDTVYGDMADAYATAREDGMNWRGVMEETTAAARDAVSTYQKNVQVTFQHAGENVDTYGAKVSQKFDEIANKSSIAADTVEDMGQDMTSTMEQIQATAWELDSAWGQVNDDMRNQIASTIGALQELLQSLDLVMERAQAAVAAVQAAAQANYGLNNMEPGYGGGSSEYSGGDPNTSGGSGPGGPYGGGQKQDNPYDGGLNQNVWTVIDPGGDAVFSDSYSAIDLWLKQHQGQGYGAVPGRKSGSYRNGATYWDTGGYTGSWGSEGRLAFLHEKELVLNKDDTSNMLTMVDMVRNIVDTVGSNGMLNTLALAAGGAGGLGSFGTALDQNVHIEANFPNVQSHTEIELALNNLINSASQYVNRKS